MWCPECGSEYVEGITRCAGCDVALVEELDEDAEPEGEDGLSELHQTHSVGELEAIVALLERADIPYLVQAGTAMNVLTRTAGLPMGVAAWEGRLWVDSRQVKEAREKLALALKKLKERASAMTPPAVSPEGAAAPKKDTTDG